MITKFQWPLDVIWPTMGLFGCVELFYMNDPLGFMGWAIAGVFVAYQSDKKDWYSGEAL